LVETSDLTHFQTATANRFNFFQEQL